MKLKKRKILLILLMIFLLCRHLYYDQIVKRAISMEKAKEIVESEENYYIVKTIDCSGGTEYEFAYGENKGKAVNLINGPDPDTSVVLENMGENRFLIKGKSIKKIYESPYEVICPREYEIEVESYEFIAPIERDYTYTKHFRFFPPKTYIDQYDVDHGDYRL